MWHEAGVEDEDQILGLRFNWRTGSVLLHAQKDHGSHPSGTIYLRRAGQDVYVRVTPHERLVSARSIVTDGDDQYAYCNLFQHVPEQPEAANWRSVERIDCTDGTCSTQVARAGLVLPDPYTDGHIVALVESRSDALIAHVSMWGDRSKKLNQFWIASISLADNRVTPLVALSHTFL